MFVGCVFGYVGVCVCLQGVCSSVWVCLHGVVCGCVCRSVCVFAGGMWV